MTMAACRADNAMFALAFADVRDPALVAQALDDLRESARRNLAADGGMPLRPLMVEGMTPNERTGRFTIAGRRPDGSAVKADVAVFVRGTTVYQATVLGTTLDADAVQTFITGLKVVQ
jgi:hypothetical protein